MPLTELDEVDDGLLGDLLIEQHLVVLEQLCDRRLSPEVVLLVRRHCLVEIKLDELGHIEFVKVVVLDAVLEEAINQLAYPGDRSALSQVREVVELVGERVEKYVHKEVDGTSFSHELLSLSVGNTLTSERI